MAVFGAAFSRRPRLKRGSNLGFLVLNLNLYPGFGDINLAGKFDFAPQYEINLSRAEFNRIKFARKFYTHFAFAVSLAGHKFGN